MRLGCGAVALLGLVGGVLPGAELVLRDVTLQINALPGGAAQISGDADDADLKSGIEIALGGWYDLAGPGQDDGWAVGVEMLHQRRDWGDGDLSLTGLRGVGGYAWQLDERWAVLAAGSLMAGFAEADLALLDDSGLGLGAAAEARAWYELTPATHGFLGLGIEAQHLTFDEAHDLLQVRLGVGISYRWRTLPTGL